MGPVRQRERGGWRAGPRCQREKGVGRGWLGRRAAPRARGQAGPRWLAGLRGKRRREEEGTGRREKKKEAGWAELGWCGSEREESGWAARRKETGLAGFGFWAGFLFFSISKSIQTKFI